MLSLAGPGASIRPRDRIDILFNLRKDCRNGLQGIKKRDALQAVSRIKIYRHIFIRLLSDPQGQKHKLRIIILRS